jgi:hypothetical protein
MISAPFSLSIKCITRKNYTNFCLLGFQRDVNPFGRRRQIFYLSFVGLRRTASADHTCTISFDGQKKWKEKATRGASSGNIWLVGLPLWTPQVLFAHLCKTVVQQKALRR